MHPARRRCWAAAFDAVGLAKFTLDLTATGSGSAVIVNGLEVTEFVRSVAVRASHGDVTTLMLDVAGDGIIAGEGVVEVRNVEGLQDAAAIVRSMDADQMQAQASGRADLGTSYTKALLALVAETLELGQ